MKHHCSKVYNVSKLEREIFTVAFSVHRGVGLQVCHFSRLKSIMHITSKHEMELLGASPPPPEIEIGGIT